jgi:hypothetical protein
VIRRGKLRQSWQPIDTRQLDFVRDDTLGSDHRGDNFLRDKSKLGYDLMSHAVGHLITDV